MSDKVNTERGGEEEKEKNEINYVCITIYLNNSKSTDPFALTLN